MKQNLKLKPILTILWFLSVISITGCSMKYFSSGWDHHLKSEKAWQAGDYAEALYQASEAIKIDYELVEPKVFLKNKHTPAMSKITAQLKSARSSSIKGAELKAHIYDRLARFHNNLKEIKLPITSEKDAKSPWKWETTIQNYDKKAEQSRKNAYKVLFKHASQLVKKADWEQAEKIFDRAITKYQLEGTPEQKKARAEANKILADAYFNKGKKLVKKGRLEEAENLFSRSVSRSSDQTKARQSADKILSAAYFKRGTKQEKRGGVQYMESAIKDYETAKKWGYNQQKIDDRITQVKGKIAEIYYRKGNKAGKRNLMQAVDAYKKALVWVPGYKDAAKRMKDLLISDELKNLPKNLAATEKEVVRLSDKPKKLAENAGKASEAMNKLTYVSDIVRKSNHQMKTIRAALVPINLIPYINAVTKPTSQIIGKAQGPVGKVAKKFDRAERPIITPTREVIEKMKGITSNVHQQIEQVSSTVGQSRKIVEEINGCLLKQQNPELLIKLGDKLKNVNKALIQTNKVLEKTNTVINKIGPAVASVAKLQPFMSKVADSMRKIEKPVAKIGKVTHEIDKVLDKRIEVKVLRKRIGFSIRKIFSGAMNGPKKIQNKLKGLAMKALNPVLKKLKIKIPSVPGLNKVNQEIDNLKSKYTVLKSKVTDIKKKVTDIEKYKKVVTNQLKEARDTACSSI